MAFGKNYESVSYQDIKNPEDFKGDNPFDPKTRNITEQMCMIKLNPALADFLKAQVGVKLTYSDWKDSNPWKAASFSKTAQDKLQATDPELAKVLKADSEGKKIGKIGDTYYEIVEGGQY